MKANITMPPKPDWWPHNPYPKSVFPMDSDDDYVRLVPDDRRRTALSGYLGRRFWQLCSDACWQAVCEWTEEHIEHKGISDAELNQSVRDARDDYRG